MGQIDNVRRLIKEDFDKEYHQLIDRLAYVVNTFMEQVTQQVNGNLDFTNLNQDIIKVKLSLDSAGLPKNNQKLRTNLINPKGLLVVKARNLTDNAVFPTTAPFISFTSVGTVITVQKITGLQADNEYELTIMIIGG